MRDLDEHLKKKFEGKVFKDCWFGGLGSHESRFLQIDYYTVINGIVYFINSDGTISESGDKLSDLLLTKEIGLFDNLKNSTKIKRKSYDFDIDEMEKLLDEYRERNISRG